MMSDSEHSAPTRADGIGVVVIGRNEGERLVRCLESVRERAAHIVYVDSGSSDDSVEAAGKLGATVIELDLSKPFTAARARNTGFAELAKLEPNLEFVQFVDGDCELEAQWLATASSHLRAHQAVGAVCGRLSERHPEASIYNRLCALEWKAPPGATSACGGIFMVRTMAFQRFGGFNETLIAGEEPEFCLRLREGGWDIHRLDEPMATHDAAMTRLGQWWKRAVRSGHAYAESAHLHRHSPRRPWRREVIRNWVWGLIIPVVAIALAWPTYGVSLALLGLYPIWMWRIARERRRRLADSTSDAWLYAVFCMFAKTPSALGQLKFRWRRLRGGPSTLIEYKTAKAGPVQHGVS